MNDLSIKHNWETTYILWTISCGKTEELLKNMYSEFINVDNRTLYIDIKKESFNNIKYDLLNKNYTVNIIDENCFFVNKGLNFTYCSLNSINIDKIISLINSHNPTNLYLDINGDIKKHIIDFIPEWIKTYITLYD